MTTDSQQNYALLRNEGQLIPTSIVNQSANHFFDISNFEKVKINNKLQILGTGSFGSVFLVRHKENGNYYALKEMNKLKLQNLIDESIVLRECNIHISLHHSNICQLHAFRSDESNFYLIMEYASNGSLFNEIQHSKNGLSETKAHNYFVQIAKAVLFLHSNNIIHRDIKPENCLLDTKRHIKLCDFGWTAQIKSNEPRTTFCGTFEYMAPEIIKEHPYTKSVDIWSLGILLFEMVHKYSPFRGKGTGNAKEIMKNILKGDFSITNQNISYKCKDLIIKLLNPNEDRRITIEEVLKHPWIIEEEYETILNKLENKSKIKGISPINSKEDENANMSLYKEIKEIEKAIDCKTNEIEQFNNKTKQMLNDVVKETSLITKRKENLIKTHIHDLSNSTFKNENFNFNDSIIVRRKEKNGKIKKKNKKMHNYLDDITNNNKFNENSTQTEIDIMNERKNSWNLLDIFKCGSH